MVEYVIKSTLCLTVLYSMHYLLLKNLKTFEFNRFYLLFTVVFSLVIPFIQFTTEIQLPVGQNIHDYTYSINNIKAQKSIENGQIYHSSLSLFDFLVFIYLTVSSILLIRFIFNLYRIIKIIKNSKWIVKSFPTIVLSTNKSLPYSFLNYIIVNKEEYERGNIEYELILHEQVHCNQKHSIDILFIEIVKIFFWFYPIFWIIRKEIELNHEYLADKNVLRSQDLNVYQQTLLNLVFRNNSTYLASDFNFSFTKKRLIMMTKNDSLIGSMARRIVMVPLILILTVTITFSQKKLTNDSLLTNEKEWVYTFTSKDRNDSIMTENSEWLHTIMTKHKIKQHPFTCFENVFELGSTISIENRVVTLTDALIIVRKNDGYSLIKSPLAYRELDKKILNGDKVVIENYKYEDGDSVNPYSLLGGNSFKLQLNNGNYTIGENVNGEFK